MNIGIITTWFERGAAYVSKQFEEVLSSAHNVYIYARGGESFAKGDPKWDTPNVYWSQYPVNSKYVDKKELQKWLIKNNIELVIFNEQKTFMPILWCKEIGVKTAAYIDYYRENTIPLFNVYDALICNTKRHLSAFEDHPNALYVPWGTNTEFYKPQRDDGELVIGDKVTFFNSAGMNPVRKGTDTFIKALSKCNNKDIKALIHSQKKLKNCFPHLSSVIDDLVENGILEVVEKTIPAPGLYYKADVYVYPSILDGIGLTVPEAISSGLACIASDNPPMNEFVHEEYGSLIPITRLYARSDAYYWPQCRCDVDALSELIQNYASNKNAVKGMKRKAREYAERHLSFKTNAKVLLDNLGLINLLDVDDKLRKKAYEFDNSRSNAIEQYIMKYKLYRLPIKIIRKFVGYRS